jgi:hypothetical protein
VAISKVIQATTIYSDDQDIEKLGTAAQIPVIGTSRLPLPADQAQGQLALEPPKEHAPDAEPKSDITEAELARAVAGVAAEAEKEPEPDI